MGRRTQNTLLVNTQQRNSVAFGYEDLTGRLSTVTKNTTRRARYAYTSGAPGQVQAVIHERFASNAWQATDTGTRVYDGFERLTSIGWTTGTGNNQATVASFAYLYNTANERTRTTLADGSYWQYVYDDLGQVSSGKRYSSTGTPIPGQQFEYTFDDIGNRTQAKAGGDASGNNLRTANYTSNLLNMYTGRGSPGSVVIMGYAPVASYPVSITTGGSTVPVDFRLLEYYQKKISWTNTAGARFEQVLVESDPTHAGTEKELWVFLPKDPEAFTHDVDGNLLQDGRWNYGWDGENRLIWMESRTDLPTAMPRQRVEFGYDFMSRRNVKRMYIPVAVAEISGGPLDEPQTVGTTTAVIDGATASVAGPGSDAAAETLPAWAVSAPVGWSQVGLSKYVWDGWNLLAELDITDASVRTFAWGLDLSGSEQGAGGIGGLVLGWTRANGTLGGEVNGTGGNTLRYVFDGNGNVMAALDDLGRARAKYEYGPFGETLSSEGDLAADNPIRWSTKYTDGESGLVYYGYRYYNAGTGRWLNRDPIGERGGRNLLALLGNRPINAVDFLGLTNLVDLGRGTFSGALGPDRLGAFGPNAVHALFELSYWPDKTKFANTSDHVNVSCKDCRRVRFVQIYKYNTNASWFTRGLGLRQTWHWDSDWTFYPNDGGGADPRSGTPANMHDFPGLDVIKTGQYSWTGMSFDFETCAICADHRGSVIGSLNQGSEYGVILGCVRWGFTFGFPSLATGNQSNGIWTFYLENADARTSWNSVHSSAVVSTNSDDQSQRSILDGAAVNATVHFSKKTGLAPSSTMREFLREKVPTAWDK